jgi:hypothetical protein
MFFSRLNLVGLFGVLEREDRSCFMFPASSGPEVSLVVWVERALQSARFLFGQTA